MRTFEFGSYGTFERFVQPQADRTAPGHVDVDPVRHIGRFRLLPAEYHPPQALDAALPQPHLLVDFASGAARHRGAAATCRGERGA